MGAWAGQTVDQNTYLGWMSSADGFNYFVNNVLPDILSGQAKLLDRNGAIADNGLTLFATTAAGSNLGLTIPQSVIDAAKNPPAPVTPVTPPTTSADQSAKDIIKDTLNKWGLGSLVDWAWGLLTQGASSDQVVAQLRETNEYKQRFKGNVERQNKGLTPLAEGEYLAYEEQARQGMIAAGLPPGFYDSPDDFAGLIGRDISPAELNSRIQIAGTIANGLTPEEKAEAARLGLTLGDQTALALDPDAAFPVVQRRLQMAQIGGASISAGYRQLSESQLDRLALVGVSRDTAQQGFSNIAHLAPLLATNAGEEGISADEVLAAQFEGNAAAQDKLGRRQKARLAQFRSDGGAATNQKGAVGLASAAQYSA